MSAAGVQQDHALDAMNAGYEVVVWARSRDRRRALYDGLVERAEARGLACEPRASTAQIRAARGRGCITFLVSGVDDASGLRPGLRFNDEWQRMR